MADAAEASDVQAHEAPMAEAAAVEEAAHESEATQAQPVAPEQPSAEAAGSSVGGTETAEATAPAKRALRVPKAEITNRMNAAKLRAPWLNDGSIVMNDYQWHALTKSDTPFIRWHGGAAPPTCDADEVKAAERGEAGVLICDQLQYQPVDRRGDFVKDGIKVKGGRVQCIQVNVAAMATYEPLYDGTGRTQAFVLGIVDRIIVVFPYDGGKLKILIGLRHNHQRYMVFVRSCALERIRARTAHECVNVCTGFE